MGEKNIEKIQDIQNYTLMILKSIKAFANKHNLRFYLAYGTLLGAIRHQGFIPWDDDVDIHMPREDYEKFIKLTKNGEKFDDDSIKLLAPLDDGYAYSFVKVINRNTKVYEKNVKRKFSTGIWVDVFPLDFIPDDNNEINNLIKQIKKDTKYLGMTTNSDKNFAKRIIKAVLMINYDYKKYVRNIINIPRSYESNKIGCVNIGFSHKQCFNKSWFQDEIEGIFESETFPIPGGYEFILKQLYGNYMELPPEKERIMKHYQKVIVNDDK